MCKIKGLYPNKMGFTLIEMLTVVMVISILTAIALPQYRRAIQKAHATQAVMMLTEINASAERLAQELGYRGLSYMVSAVSAGTENRFTFKRMDTFNEDTMSACSFNTAGTVLTCEEFEYALNNTLNYASATKLINPYAGVEFRLSRGGVPSLTCRQGGDLTTEKAQEACDLYGIDFAS